MVNRSPSGTSPGRGRHFGEAPTGAAAVRFVVQRDQFWYDFQAPIVDAVKIHETRKLPVAAAHIDEGAIGSGLEGIGPGA